MNDEFLGSMGQFALQVNKTVESISLFPATSENLSGFHAPALV
jgi:hypothetical protein